VLVFTALTVPVVVIVGALALGLTTLWTSRQDVQRSADLGALAAAANAPTLSSELPLSGLTLLQDLEMPLDPLTWRERACAVAKAQLVGGRAAISNVFSDGDVPSCQPTWKFESPLLAVLDGCLRDIDDLAGCRDRLDEELRHVLPAIDSLDASITSATDQVHQLLDPVDKLVGAALSTQLGDACAAQTGVDILGVAAWVCDHRVGDVLNAVDRRTGAVVGVLDSVLQRLVPRVQRAVVEGRLNPMLGGLGFDDLLHPQVAFDLAGFAPAAVTPRVQVDLAGLDVQPMLSPSSFDMHATATARRVIKSALVLPSIGIPGVNAWSELTPWTQAQLTRLLGPDAAGTLERAGVRGRVIDPNVYTAKVPDVADKVFNLFDAMETRLSSVVSNRLCAALPPTLACPVGDDLVDHDHLLGPFMEDVWDATRPPPTGTAPTIREVLAEYADSLEPVTVVGGLSAVVLETVLSGEVLDTLRNPQVPGMPDVSQLISPLMFIPAMDVMQATVERDGDLFRLEPVLATTGLYKARLVR
jgi:hypothetical protein